MTEPGLTSLLKEYVDSLVDYAKRMRAWMLSGPQTEDPPPVCSTCHRPMTEHRACYWCGE